MEDMGARDMSEIGFLTKAIADACPCRMRPRYVITGIPDSMGHLSKLMELYLSSNELTGERFGVGGSKGGWYGMCTLARRDGSTLCTLDVHVWQRAL